MAPVLTVGANWLHLLATVAMVGIYLLLGLVFTPVFVQQLNGIALGKMVVGVYNKARLYLVLALLIFAVTGIYLTLINDQYSGMAQVNNQWTLLLVIKHGVVGVLIVLAIYMQRGPVARLESKLRSGDEAGIKPVVERLKSLEYAAMLCGVIVLLLTAMVELA